MRYAFFIILCFLISNVIFAQKNAKQKYTSKSKKAIALYEEGVNHSNFGRFADALNCFEAAKQIDKNFAELYFFESDVYSDLGEYEKQCECLKKGLSLDSTMFVRGYCNLGIALYHLGKYDEAEIWFDKFLKNSKSKRYRETAEQMLQKVHQIRQIMENPVDFKPHYICDNLRTKYDAYWPSLTLDEEEFVFTMLAPRDTSGISPMANLPLSALYQEDFYMSRKLDGEWQPISPVRGVNTPSNEGAQALSADGRWMFFTACGRRDSKGSCDLYFSRRTAEGWSEPINVGAPVNTPYWESQPSFSADGQTLYFVSSRPGGKGGNDIWSAKIVDYTSQGVPIFGSVVNLGDSINTSGDEVSPFLHPDGRTLYFSSDGWVGIGAQDIFYSSQKLNGQWSTPRNIGYPINTAFDDNGLIVNATGNMAYLSSERKLENGQKRRELLCFELPEQVRPQPVSYVKGYVADMTTKLPIANAQVELVRLDNGMKQVVAQSDENGNFIACLPPGRDYGLFVSSKGYLFQSQTFALSDTAIGHTNEHIEVSLPPMKVGVSVALRNVFFDFNSIELKSESFVELDKLVRLLNENSSLKIEIGGHTDNVGTAEYNIRLSEGRAQAAANYLIDKGVGSFRISHKGYGMSKPIADNSTEEGRALNRRIEAKIIE